MVDENIDVHILNETLLFYKKYLCKFSKKLKTNSQKSIFFKITTNR